MLHCPQPCIKAFTYTKMNAKFVICVAVFLHLISSTLAADSCPLTLTELNYNSHCFEDATDMSVTLYNITLPVCCLDLMAGLARILAAYANSTGYLLLNASQEHACLNDLVNVTTCTEVAEKFIAGSSPCAFPTVSNLNTALKAAGISFEDVLGHCTGTHYNSSVDCNSCASSFNNAVEVLARTLGDVQYVCAGTLVIGLAKLRVDDPIWLNSLFGCVQAPNSGGGLTASPAKRNANRIKTIAIVSGLLTVIALIIAMIVYSKLRRDVDYYSKRPDPGELQNGESHHSRNTVGLYTFSAHEILTATNSFHEDNFLGEGSAGKVFKGVLPSGQFVAVKRIDKDKKLETYDTELISLSAVRHPHLVTLMGFCQYGDEYQLVYEYCPNGNLSQWLFSDDGRFLSWKQRLTIAINSARALWFLHDYPGGPIVHRDIKPTNILLSEHMEAKLSDFGLSRSIQMEQSKVFTEVKGTAGYLDPEYVNMGELTKASDVYSFGIVLLQLISGRRAIDLDLTHRLSLVKTAKLLAEENEDLTNFVDPCLEGQYSYNAVEQVFQVAVMCTAYSRLERLTMKEVLHYLEQANYESTYYSNSALVENAPSVVDDEEYEYVSPYSLPSKTSPSIVATHAR